MHQNYDECFPGSAFHRFRYQLPLPLRAEALEAGPFMTYFQIETERLEDAAEFIRTVQELARETARRM